MANSFQKGLGGAAQGAAVGAAIPVIGAPIGAVVGGIAGLFGGSDSSPPSMYTDQETQRLKQYAMTNPDFNISLAKENPELYRALMKNDVYLQDLQQMYNQRSQGPTAQENQSVRDYMNEQGSGMASSGLAGTPMGNAMMSDAQARQMNPIFQRMFQEKQGMLGQIGQANQAQFANTLAGQQAVLAQQNANRAAAIGQLGQSADQNQNKWAFDQGNQFNLGDTLLGAASAYQGIKNAQAYGDKLSQYNPAHQDNFYDKLSSLPDPRNPGAASPVMDMTPAQEMYNPPAYNGAGSMNYQGMEQPQQWPINYAPQRSALYHPSFTQGRAPVSRPMLNPHFPGHGPGAY